MFRTRTRVVLGSRPGSHDLLRSNGRPNKKFIPDDIASLMGEEASSSPLSSPQRQTKKTQEAAAAQLINTEEATTGSPHVKKVKRSSSVALVASVVASPEGKQHTSLPRPPAVPASVANLSEDMTQEMITEPLVSDETSTGVKKQRRAVPKAPLRKTEAEEAMFDVDLNQALEVAARDAAKKRADDALKATPLTPGMIPRSSLQAAELLGKSKMRGGLCPKTGFVFVACDLKQVRNNFSTNSQFLSIPGTKSALVGYVSANFASELKLERGVRTTTGNPKLLGNNIFYSVHREEPESARETATALDSVVAAADEVLSAAKLVVPPRKRGRPPKKVAALLEEAGASLVDQKDAVAQLKQAAKTAIRGNIGKTTLVFSWDPNAPLTLTHSGRATILAKTQGFASLATTVTENWGASLCVLGPRPSKEEIKAAKEERTKKAAEDAKKEVEAGGLAPTADGATPKGFISEKALGFATPLVGGKSTQKTFLGGVDSATGFAFITCQLRDIKNNKSLVDQGADNEFVAIPYAYVAVAGIVTHNETPDSSSSLLVDGGIDLEVSNKTPKKIGDNLFFSTKMTDPDRGPTLIFSFHPKATPKRSRSGKANVLAKTQGLSSLSDRVAVQLVVLKANSYMLHKIGVSASQNKGPTKAKVAEPNNPDIVEL